MALQLALQLSVLCASLFLKCCQRMPRGGAGGITAVENLSPFFVLRDFSPASITHFFFSSPRFSVCTSLIRFHHAVAANPYCDALFHPRARLCPWRFSRGFPSRHYVFPHRRPSDDKFLGFPVLFQSCEARAHLAAFEEKFRRSVAVIAAAIG